MGLEQRLIELVKKFLALNVHRLRFYKTNVTGRFLSPWQLVMSTEDKRLCY